MYLYTHVLHPVCYNVYKDRTKILAFAKYKEKLINDRQMSQQQFASNEFITCACRVWLL